MEWHLEACRNKRLLFLQREDEVENKGLLLLGTQDFGALNARVALTFPWDCFGPGL